MLIVKLFTSMIMLSLFFNQTEAAQKPGHTFAELLQEHIKNGLNEDTVSILLQAKGKILDVKNIKVLLDTKKSAALITPKSIESLLLSLADEKLDQTDEKLDQEKACCQLVELLFSHPVSQARIAQGVLNNQNFIKTLLSATIYANVGNIALVYVTNSFIQQFIKLEEVLQEIDDKDKAKKTSLNEAEIAVRRTIHCISCEEGRSGCVIL